ncbi:MAG: phosphatidylserine decarboxylase [Bacteroidota bacterium]|nr:phosphatidylserine decarboxylase [Bacteroidota bacterium]
MLTKYGTDNIIIMLLIGLGLIAIGFIFTKLWVATIFWAAGTLLCIFTLWFFRDPDRTVPVEALKGEEFVISPADGIVVEITEREEPHYLKCKAVQVSIFLSPLDVHVNRIPISGEVKYFKYNPGNYLVAYHPKSSELNEQTHIGIENNSCRIFFKQITGILARRLVWDIKVGDSVQVGQRFGMMKFGSRIDLFFTLGSELFVKKGDRVRSGETIVGRAK